MKKAYCVFGYQCNNNCRICAVSSRERALKEEMSASDILGFVSKLSAEIKFLEISGGEPTIRQDFFDILDGILKLRSEIKFHLLTNGRRASAIDFSRKLAEYPIELVIVAIHHSTPAGHDYLTRVSGSFVETMHGIHNMLEFGVPISLKTIVTKLNYNDLANIASLVLSRFDGIKFFSFHGLDVRGEAWKNREEVVVNYREVKDYLQRATDLLESCGIEVRYYGIPYCMVDESYWKNVSPQPYLIYGYKSTKAEKVNQLFMDDYGTVDACRNCKMRAQCYGMWRSYLRCVGDSVLEPIV